MKEVISLQVGKCGNRIGTQCFLRQGRDLGITLYEANRFLSFLTFPRRVLLHLLPQFDLLEPTPRQIYKFWELICSEHGLDRVGMYRGGPADIQLQRITNYFREVRGMRYVPRSIMIDLDKESMEVVKTSPYASIFREDNYVYGRGGTGSNWAKAHLTEGVQLKEGILDVTRREAENTDCLQGFQIIHSIAGGTGSGLTALLMNSLHDEYANRNISTFTVVPSPEDDRLGMEIYNAVLSISHLVIQSDATYFIDNQALHRIFSRIPTMAQYQMVDLNHLIASAISGITTSMRFEGNCNTDFRKIAFNYVPFPRMHFFVPAVAPIVPRGETRVRTTSVAELLHSLLFPKKMFVECDATFGKILTVVFFVRGNVCRKEVVSKLEEVQNRNSAKFVDWVPDNSKAFVYEMPATVMNVSATMITNTAAIQNLFQQLKDRFYKMFRRRAYLTPYTSEGMEEMEFEEAASSLHDLVDEYKQSQFSRSGTTFKGSESSIKEEEE